MASISVGRNSAVGRKFMSSEYGIPFKSFPIETLTRWNSTLEHLISNLYNDEALNKFHEAGPPKLSPEPSRGERQPANCRRPDAHEPSGKRRCLTATVGKPWDRIMSP